MTSRLSTLLKTILPLAVAAVGCAAPREQIPTYPLETVPAAIATVQARSAELRSLTGRGAVTLSDPKRGSVRLDSVFVLAPPDRARVRAWKFNQAVLDLTVTPEGVWLYSPRDPKVSDAKVNDSGAATTQPGGNVAGGIREWLRYLNAGVPADAVVARSDDRTIMLTNSDASGGILTTTLDRATRTVRSYRLENPKGVERFTLTLDRYRTFGSTLWPARLEARSVTGTIVVETRELEPNVAAETAFTSPPRAKRLP